MASEILIVGVIATAVLVGLGCSEGDGARRCTAERFSTRLESAPLQWNTPEERDVRIVESNAAPGECLVNLPNWTYVSEHFASRPWADADDGVLKLTCNGGAIVFRISPGQAGASDGGEPATWNDAAAQAGVTTDGALDGAVREGALAEEDEDAVGDARSDVLAEEAGPQESWWYTLRVELPGDPRDWQPGTDRVFVSEDDASCYYRTSSATVTVEEAVGGRAPSPDGVTPDFRRVFRIDFDTSQQAPLDAGIRCMNPAVMRGALRLTVERRDYAYVESYCQMES